MEKKHKKLYLLTVKRGHDFYVIADSPNEAQNELEKLLNKAEWWFSGDRETVNIKLLSTEYGCYFSDKPNFGEHGGDLIIVY